jgi:hypothetical protein
MYWHVRPRNGMFVCATDHGLTIVYDGREGEKDFHIWQWSKQKFAQWRCDELNAEEARKLMRKLR